MHDSALAVRHVTRDELGLPQEILAQLDDLTTAYGQPSLVLADLPDGLFDPLIKTDRIGEVCMVLRRRNGRILTCRKEIYPPGVMRLLTGGIHPGEPIAEALMREVAEETSLEVAVRRFLSLIAYRAPTPPRDDFTFFTFAFLLDELSGELQVQDPDERIEAFEEVEIPQLYAQAAFMEHLDASQSRVISGSWRAWGQFRGVTHRIVADLLS
ncbi:NUDIX hydrolase [Candidatus Oscillochloris fontis]|uniref:NUDIX hydrolase n=1 Tax=Candidatus Oscillochloris fontis TaxID=2496868 RepID=UPI00101CFBC4|nr:NUDIX hydrolase [Candidatus Oscillochloris fontis]